MQLSLMSPVVCVRGVLMSGAVVIVMFGPPTVPATAFWLTRGKRRYV